MKTIVRNVLAVIVGAVIGSVVNALLVSVGPKVIPLPEGADVSSPEKLRDSMQLFTPANFLFPFLAHALGTLAGAFIAAEIAASRRTLYALSVGVLFLAGGITMVVIAGGPLWFILADLLLAYLPMACLGAKLASATRVTDVTRPL